MWELYHIHFWPSGGLSPLKLFRAKFTIVPVAIESPSFPPTVEVLADLGWFWDSIGFFPVRWKKKKKKK